MNNHPDPGLGFDVLDAERLKHVVHALLVAFENKSLQGRDVTWDQLREKSEALAPYEAEVLRHCVQILNLWDMVKDLSVSSEGFFQNGLTRTGALFQSGNPFRYYGLLSFLSDIGLAALVCLFVWLVRLYT